MDVTVFTEMGAHVRRFRTRVLSVVQLPLSRGFAKFAFAAVPLHSTRVFSALRVWCRLAVCICAEPAVLARPDVPGAFTPLTWATPSFCTRLSVARQSFPALRRRCPLMNRGAKSDRPNSSGRRPATARFCRPATSPHPLTHAHTDTCGSVRQKAAGGLAALIFHRGCSDRRPSGNTMTRMSAQGTV